MHFDFIGNHFQGQRPQMTYPMNHEGVLLFDDFARHFENGLSPLIQALGQPMGRLHAIGHEFLFIRRAQFAANLRNVGIVDQHFGQRFTVQLDVPGSVIGLFDKDIGNNVLDRDAFVSCARFWIKCLNFKQNISQVLDVEIAQRLQRVEIALCQKIQIAQDRFHRRIEAILFDELQTEAFNQVACTDANGFETLHNPQCLFASFFRAPKTFGNGA